MRRSSAKLCRHEALAFLMGRINYERTTAASYDAKRFRLDRMRELLVRLDRPDAGLKIIHVAGTKGKGSTAAMIASALSAAGYRTGRYTSPHLERIEERFAIDGHPCGESEFCELVELVRPVVAEMDRASKGPGAFPSGPTYFELTTALALLHFARSNVEAAVLEVGLGGRLDSTNVCRPAVSVITSISLDHTKQLGNSLESIAREKGGIIKSGIPVVSGVVEGAPRRVIEDICRQTNSQLVQLGRHFDYTYRPAFRLDQAPTYGHLDVLLEPDDRTECYLNVPLALPGRHQAANAAVAIATLDVLKQQGWTLSENAIKRGLAEVDWPARVEVVSRQPTVVLDGAHNVASVAALVETLNESFQARRRRLVFGSSADKDVRGMLATLLPHFDDVVFTRTVLNPRGVRPSELAAIAADLGRPDARQASDPALAWDLARRDLAAEDFVCVTGSLYMAGEIRPLLAASPAVPLTAEPV